MVPHKTGKATSFSQKAPNPAELDKTLGEESKLGSNMSCQQHGRKNEDVLDKGAKPVYLVSACLFGLRTRYDAQVKPEYKSLEFPQDVQLIPVCPEQLGGLPTPRTPADIEGGDGYDVIAGNARVVTRDGRDVTEPFLLGAHQVLEIARKLKVEAVLFKSKSPSCGLTPRIGVTAALLDLNRIEVQEFG